MNVIFTCGGTGGHINPAIAVANIMKERHPDCNILFIGAEGRMEEKLVPQAGYDLKCLPGAGLSRKKNLEGLKHNIKVAGQMLGLLGKCRKIIKEFKPDVILGTGGYASFPALMAGSQLGIPTVIHESNAMPGLTTRLTAQWANKVLVCFEASAKHYKDPEKVEVVGMPVRRDFIYADKKKAREELGLGDGPVVVSAFGSLGARAMNLCVADMLTLEKENGYPFHHIHATGSYGWQWMPEHVKEAGVNLEEAKHIDMREYIYNMPTVMAAADLIISRAGASSCNEIAATGTPCILIPSPNVTDNHQEKNARVLADRGAAELVLESECSGQVLYQKVTELLSDQQKRQEMTSALYGVVVLDSAERICDMMEQLAAQKQKKA